MNYNPFKSKTNITVVIMFLIPILNAIAPTLPPLYQAIIEGILGVLAVIFHTTTAIQAGATN